MINSSRFRLTAEINRQAQLGRDVARLQTEVSTGKRIFTPSDDPLAAARISEIGRTQADNLSYAANLNAATALSDRADGTIADVTSLVDRAHELMLSASSGSKSADERRIAATELRGLAEQIGVLAVTKDSRGVDLFSATTALQIPVANGITLAAVGSRDSVFNSVPTVTGPRSYVDIINSAADSLELTDNAARQTATDASLVELEAAVGRVATVAGEQGVRAVRIQGLQDRGETTKLQIEEERVNLESADIPQVVAMLSSKKLSLDAAQAVFARVNQTNLFDLLR